MTQQELYNLVGYVSLQYDLSLWSPDKIDRFTKGLWLYLQPYLETDKVFYQPTTTTKYIPETTGGNG